MAGYPPYPNPRRRARRRGLRWWQKPLLVVTFPVSVLVYLLGTVGARVVAYVRAVRWWRFGLGFVVVWAVLGQLTVWTAPRDPYVLPSGIYEDFTREARAGPPTFDPRQPCDPTDGAGGNKAAWPLARPFVWVLSCEAWLGHRMLAHSGLDAQADWVVRQYEKALLDAFVGRQIGSPYLFMGLLALAELVLVLPWLLLWGLWQVVRHVRVDWVG